MIYSSYVNNKKCILNTYIPLPLCFRRVAFLAYLAQFIKTKYPAKLSTIFKLSAISCTCSKKQNF